jgi:hypothetical protein
MQPTEQPQTVEAFLLIEQPRQRLGHWTRALAALDSPDAPPIAAIVAYYDPTSDQALLDLHYDAETANMKFVIDIALLAEVGVVQPLELSEGERVRFLADRLTRCTIRVTSQRSACAALYEVARRIRDVRTNKPATTQPPPIPQAALVRSIAPRGDTSDPVMLVGAKGTRDNLERLPDESVGEEADTPVREPTQERAAAAILANPDRHRTVPMPLDLAQRLIGESSQLMDLRMLPKPPPRSEPLPLPLPPPDVHTPPPMLMREITPVRDTVPSPTVPPTRHEKKTVKEPTPPPKLREQATPPRLRGAVREETPSPRLRNPPQRLRDEVRHRTPSPRLRTEAQKTDPFVPRPSQAHLPTPGMQFLPNVIYARYLRSGRWVPVRVGALSLKGAALLAGALPRSNDRVDVAFTFGSHRAIVRGIVGKVSSMREAAQTGASTFNVAFELDDNSRRQLTALLTAARDAKITIKPPPPRATRRFPVEWNIALGTIRGAVKATALDVSMQGMFVQAAVPLEVGSTLTFSIVLDDQTSPIAGRARVVRQIRDAEAKECGLLVGFGLLIVSMSEADRMRWLGFLARIERRADKRVLIGADPARLAELQAGLASLGYAVTGGTDPGALVQLANSDARPADAVLIDADWLQNEASASLMENLFSARNVPCVTMQGEVRRARMAIDKLLEVVV